MFAYKPDPAPPKTNRTIPGLERRVTRRSRSYSRPDAIPVGYTQIRHRSQDRRVSAFGTNPQPEAVEIPVREEIPPDSREHSDSRVRRNWFHIREEVPTEVARRRPSINEQKVRRNPPPDKRRRRSSPGVEELRRSLLVDEDKNARLERALQETPYPESDQPSRPPDRLYPRPVSHQPSPPPPPKKKRTPKEEILPVPVPEPSEPRYIPPEDNYYRGISVCSMDPEIPCQRMDMDEDGREVSSFCHSLRSFLTWMCCPFVPYKEID